MWSSASKSCLIFCAHLSFPVAKEKKKMNAPAGNQTRVSSVAGTYTITVLPALILMSAQLVSTQSDNFVILQDSQCRNAMSAEAMAQWQRVGFQTQRLGVRIPLASCRFFFYPSAMHQKKNTAETGNRTQAAAATTRSPATRLFRR